MKRLLTLLTVLLVFSGTVFAQEEGDFYDDGYIYEQNGAGDQFIKVDLSANFPLNFKKKLYVGGGFSIGYYRFMNNFLAVGGEVSPTYNISIGKKSLITIPITFGVLFQPTINKFEFPMGVSLGITSSTFENTFTYFPSFTAKAYAGAFYRINDSWSAGINSSFIWIAQWMKDSSESYHGLFAAAGISMRYHF